MSILNITGKSVVSRNASLSPELVRTVDDFKTLLQEKNCLPSRNNMKKLNSLAPIQPRSTRGPEGFTSVHRLLQSTLNQPLKPPLPVLTETKRTPFLCKGNAGLVSTSFRERHRRQSNRSQLHGGNVKPLIQVQNSGEYDTLQSSRKQKQNIFSTLVNVRPLKDNESDQEIHSQRSQNLAPIAPSTAATEVSSIASVAHLHMRPIDLYKRE